MPRNYRHIMQYEKEMMKLKNEGMTVREIGERFGLTYDQTHDFFKRQNRKKRKIEAGKVIHKRGRPCKKEGELPPSVQRLDKLAQMRYAMASKDRYIKHFEVSSHDVDVNDHIKPSSLQRYMMETAMCQMRDRKPTYGELFHKDQAFILTRVTIEIPCERGRKE